MSTHVSVDPVVKQVTVERPVDEAFRLFTAGIADWWPLESHSIASDEPTQAETVVFEEREGGKVYERLADGSVAYWADVLEWEPPRRFVLSWQPNPEAPAATEIEVTFTPVGPKQTLVELEHRGWERLGDRSELARTEYDSGWDGVLGRYAGRSQENGAAIASLVLGIVSLVIPFVAVIGSPRRLRRGPDGAPESPAGREARRPGDSRDRARDRCVLHLGRHRALRRRRHGRERRRRGHRRRGARSRPCRCRSYDRGCDRS